MDNQQLRGLKLLQNIAEKDYQQLLQCLGAYQKDYPKSEYIIFDGKRIPHIGAVLSGKVQMMKEDFWGSKSIFANVPTGDVFGESLVCGGIGRSIVSFRAIADCRILFLPFKQVLCSCSRSCQFHQQLVENMVTIIAEKNVALMEKMEVVSKKTIRERILTYLSQQMQRGDCHYFECPMGRVDLADYLCVDRSALTRELSRMREEGLLDYDRNTYTLK